MEDLTGKRFGRLTAVKYTGRRTENVNKYPIWECVCECGNIAFVNSCALKSGHTKSCGCYARDMKSKVHGTHHGSKTRLYNVWFGMKQRCTKETDDAYQSYGGRGITLCPEWEDFANFREWAIANGYDENAKTHECTIDRIDNNGPYSPENCRWVTPDIQSRNKRNNRYYTINGETMILKDWARHVGVDVRTICARLNRGWTIEDALFKPIDHRRGIRGKEKIG